MKLIINADDFGLCESVNNGIIKSHTEGVLTSTTLMVNMPGAQHAFELMKEHKDLGVGIHLVLSAGKPLTACKSLMLENGNFDKNYRNCIYGDPKEIEVELRAQMDKFLESGFKPSHIDSHHNIHGYNPDVKRIAEALALEHGIPLRIFDGIDTFYSDSTKIEEIKRTEKFNDLMWPAGDAEKLISLIKKYLCCKTVEISCHPGLNSEELESISSYNKERELEVAALTDEKVIKFIKDNKIELINFNDIK